MTTPIPPATGYATIADYELRSGIDVPVDQEPMIQQRLNDTSALIDVYLGDCADEVAAKYPDVLTTLTCSHVYRVGAAPVGIRSESVGATSVSYDTDVHLLDLIESETALLDALLDGACGTSSKGVGQIGVTLGGPKELTTDEFGFWPDPDEVDIWVLSGGRRR
jgi:phage gp36-like protein